MPANHDVRTIPTGTSAQLELSVMRSMSFQGPIPPPELLRQYNEIVPGAAERMIASAETQAAHRQRLERENSESNIYNSKCGIYSAFIIAIVGIGGGCVIVYAGKDSEHGAVACATAGAAIAGVTLVGLVAAFLKGTNSRREERESKSEMMTQALKNKRS